MIAHRKVEPPVTPRIVRTTPRQRLARLAVLLAGALLLLWAAYQYGRASAPDAPRRTAQAQTDDGGTQRNAELARENASLKARIAELEQGLSAARAALARARSTRGEPAARPGASTPATSPAAGQVTKAAPKPPSPAPASKPFQLEITNVRIDPAAKPGHYDLALTVRDAADTNARLAGTLWIAIDGLSGKTPTRLSFRQLSGDKRGHVKLAFSGHQPVRERISLPAGFTPRRLILEAKPYGDKYSGDARAVDWPTP